MQRALALDASPPLSFSLRFFLTAPLFILFAAGILITIGPAALSSRWHPAILAITHLLVLGTLAQSMIGALLQILPVATGIKVFHANRLVWLIYGTLNLGTLGLAAGFLSGQGSVFTWASILLAVAFGAFMGALTWGLWRDRLQQTKGAPTILMAVRLALIALVITILLGLWLSSHMIFSWPLSRWLTNLHAGWGLFGWVGLLVIGISYQVVPIFQVTERFPDPMTRLLAPVIFFLIICFSTLLYLAPSWASMSVTSILFLAFSLYALTALHLLKHRKRAHPDTTTLFLRTALVSTLLCLVVWALYFLLSFNSPLPLAHTIIYLRQLPIALGALVVFGFAWSAINGMLYTILPFLLWYNAQRHAPIVIRALPKVRHYLPDQRARPQYYGHLLALIFLLAAIFCPTPLIYLAALSLMVSVGWLYKNIFSALIHYQHALQLIHTTLENKNK